MVDSTMNEGVVLRFAEPGGVRSVVLEDNGAVAYAYLLEKGAVVADVWLYNVGAAPERVDWKDRSAMPFLNPRRYCTDTPVVSRLCDDSAVICMWSVRGVDILLDGQRIAWLEHGSKPGWSRFAALAGPLARPLEDAPAFHGSG
jgi:hypothetical protein